MPTFPFWFFLAAILAFLSIASTPFWTPNHIDEFRFHQRSQYRSKFHSSYFDTTRVVCQSAVPPPTATIQFFDRPELIFRLFERFHRSLLSLGDLGVGRLHRALFLVKIAKPNFHHCIWRHKIPKNRWHLFFSSHCFGVFNFLTRNLIKARCPKFQVSVDIVPLFVPGIITNEPNKGKGVLFILPMSREISVISNVMMSLR